MKKLLNKYIKIMRLDHCIKQFFIVPGIIIAMALINPLIDTPLIRNIVLAFFATTFIASANYVINEYLDRDFDKYHPIKKYRPIVSGNINVKIIWLERGILTIFGTVLARHINVETFCIIILFWLMGILYNVKPFRIKDRVYLDVLSESFNNALRFLIGWFCITTTFLPPITIILGYWLCGAFLMNVKRFSEYKMINNPEIAGLYRKSFQFYSEKKLLIISFFYAMFATTFCSIFLIKYHIEYVFSLPFLFGLFALYFSLSYKEDSVVQKPEKLFKEKSLMLYIVFLTILFILLTFTNIPSLQDFLLNSKLIRI